MAQSGIERVLTQAEDLRPASKPGELVEITNKEKRLEGLARRDPELAEHAVDFDAELCDVRRRELRTAGSG